MASSSAAGPAVGAATVEADTADVSVIREPGGGAVVFVSFRTASPIEISPGHALRVETPTGRFEAALGGRPHRVNQEGAALLSAEYRLAEAGARALDAAGDRARVSVHDGEAYRTYAVRRQDVID
jgi:hypothetical protein